MKALNGMITIGTITMARATATLRGGGALAANAAAESVEEDSASCQDSCLLMTAAMSDGMIAKFDQSLVPRCEDFKETGTCKCQ